MYRPYCRPDGSLAKTQPSVWRRACEILEDLSAAEAEAIVGLEFPYDYATYRYAVDGAFQLNVHDEEQSAWYWAVQDAIRSNGEPWDHVYDREWIEERYAGWEGDDGDFDDEDGIDDEDEDSLIPFIRGLRIRRHDTGHEIGNVYDTGIRGTLSNPTYEDCEEFLTALAQHGPFAFILDERDVYNVACVDSRHHLFHGIWEGPAFADAVTSARRAIERQDFGYVEYNVANTISIMRDFYLDDDEITAFLRGNEQDYACSYYFVNEYLRQNGSKRYFDDPFADE